MISVGFRESPPLEVPPDEHGSYKRSTYESRGQAGLGAKAILQQNNWVKTMKRCQPHGIIVPKLVVKPSPETGITGPELILRHSAFPGFP